ncbi:hypothetical protein [Streptomyces sp. NPDC058401]|uniref:hypothetical protein n=1 Tax=Streptomyces sp. NPDC058401 TaxID=3346480 RepID=UPI0036468890
MKFRQHLAALVTTTALLTGLGAVAATGTASAATTATCHKYSGSDKSTATGKLKGTYNLKNGVGADCGNIQSVSSSVTLNIGCYKQNPDSGVWWIYVKAGSNWGWISSDNFASFTGGSGSAGPNC